MSTISGYENSVLKSSFSLSSLRSAPAPPCGTGDQLERPYHSLTKKRKEPCREAWRRSWGSAASGGSVVDDLWPLLQHHYEYIMDNQIIDSCKVTWRMEHLNVKWESLRLLLSPDQRNRDGECSDTVAAAHIQATSSMVGAAAISAEQAKWRKYENLDSSFIFVPFGVETLGPWGQEARALFKELLKKGNRVYRWSWSGQLPWLMN
ncbi:jg14926 [Pararge aegeria aegeria]|uniref:Jg14926 protein n=1 Tax=Pararge aegeria aegeria TaxID=348720 RepID=A0A8S4QI43_9NEOP|nr:jg14926 [Pararge aegeria aegeria]